MKVSIMNLLVTIKLNFKKIVENLLFLTKGLEFFLNGAELSLNSANSDETLFPLDNCKLLKIKLFSLCVSFHIIT